MQTERHKKGKRLEWKISIPPNFYIHVNCPQVQFIMEITNKSVFLISFPAKDTSSTDIDGKKLGPMQKP